MLAFIEERIGHREPFEANGTQAGYSSSHSETPQRMVGTMIYITKLRANSV